VDDGAAAVHGYGARLLRPLIAHVSCSCSAALCSNPFVAQTRGVSVGMCQRNDGKRRAVCVRSLEERVVRACAHTPRSVYVGGRPPPSREPHPFRAT